MLDQRTRPALSGNHDGHGAHALQHCLAHCVRMCAARHVCGGGARRRWGCGWWSSMTQRTVAARHNGRRIGGDHQSLGSWESVPTVCVGSAHSPTSPAPSCEALPIVASVGVGVVAGFGVVPVTAVVGVGGGERVVLRGRGVRLERLHRRRPLWRKIVLSEKCECGIGLSCFMRQ